MCYWVIIEPIGHMADSLTMPCDSFKLIAMFAQREGLLSSEEPIMHVQSEVTSPDCVTSLDCGFPPVSLCEAVMQCLLTLAYLFI